MLKPTASKSWHEQYLSWAHLNGSSFTAPPVVGIDFMFTSSLADKYLVPLDQNLVSSDLLLVCLIFCVPSARPAQHIFSTSQKATQTLHKALSLPTKADVCQDEAVGHQPYSLPSLLSLF